MLRRSTRFSRRDGWIFLIKFQGLEGGSEEKAASEGLKSSWMRFGGNQVEEGWSHCYLKKTENEPQNQRVLQSERRGISLPFQLSLLVLFPVMTLDCIPTSTNLFKHGFNFRCISDDSNPMVPCIFQPSTTNALHNQMRASTNVWPRLTALEPLYHGRPRFKSQVRLSRPIF